jgi:deoxyribose-phosphate aldolase
MSLDLARYIDHTLLNPTATSAEVAKLCTEAKDNGFFAVCVNPVHVRQAVRELSSSPTVVAAVVGFPLGANLTDIKIAEAQKALSEGAEELDMVINIGALKENNLDYVRSEIESIVRVAGKHIVKVIIECDLLTKEEKVHATEQVVLARAAFVKTSTGFVKDSIGATVEDVMLFQEVIGGRPVKIKASGGIRDFAKAKALIDAGASRLGTSAGVQIVLGSKPEAAAAAY